MITEENLEQLLKNLRTGKYDTEPYDIKLFGTEQITIIDNQNQVSVNILLTQTISKEKYDVLANWTNSSKFYRIFHKKPEVEYDSRRIIIYYFNTVIIDKYNANYIKRDTLDNVSEDLYNSFISYIKERLEQDRLILNNQVQSSFEL